MLGLWVPYDHLCLPDVGHMLRPTVRSDSDG